MVYIAQGQMDEPKFDCKKCGLCCRLAGCSKLNPDNTCSIYETRPDLCNSEKMFELRKEMIKVGKEDYFKLSAQLCETLRKIFK